MEVEGVGRAVALWEVRQGAQNALQRRLLILLISPISVWLLVLRSP